MTIVMQLVSKSQLKSRLLEFLRKIEKDKIPVIVTHGGKPVAKISPYKEDPSEILKALQKSVIVYKDPILSVGDKDWELLR